eukprot:UN03788
MYGFITRSPLRTQLWLWCEPLFMALFGFQGILIECDRAKELNILDAQAIRNYQHATMYGSFLITGIMQGMTRYNIFADWNSKFWKPLTFEQISKIFCFW